MSYRDLTIPEMIRVSTPWVTNGDPARLVMLETPELAALMPRLMRVHTALFLVLPPECDEREEELKVQAAEGNSRHDRGVRHIHACFDVVAETQSKEDAQKLMAIRDILLPHGLRHTQRSYRAKAGHAQRSAAQLTEEQWARLGEAAIGKTTLRAIVEEWIATAAKLGEVEQERARLRDPEEEGPAHPSQVRGQWIRVVRVVVDLAKLTELDEEKDFLLFNELRVALARTDKRGQQEEPDASQEPEQRQELDSGEEPQAHPEAEADKPSSVKAIES
jgi:hypothetical protein